MHFSESVMTSLTFDSWKDAQKQRFLLIPPNISQLSYRLGIICCFYLRIVPFFLPLCQAGFVFFNSSKLLGLLLKNSVLVCYYRINWCNNHSLWVSRFADINFMVVTRCIITNFAYMTELHRFYHTKGCLLYTSRCV